MKVRAASAAWWMALVALGVVSVGALGCGPGGNTGSDAGVDAGAAWQTVYEGSELGGAVLSAWGTGADDVYVVGGPLGNGGFNAVAWHFDGATWKDLEPGGVDSFWWVSGSGPNDVWMVGEKGRMTHWDGMSFKEYPRVTTATVWGVFAFSPTDAWAVAGTPEGGTAAPNDVILRWDGQAWTQESLPGMPLGRALNKIWGTSAENLYAVGELGTVWHRKGTTWTLESEPPVAQSTLLTVYGCSATDVYAVGGLDVLHSDGAGWSKVDVSLSNAVNGVTCGAAGEVLLVGFGGLKQRFEGGAWINEFDVEPYGDLHGSWADGRGAFWAVGGDFISKPVDGKARKAIVARYGPAQVAPIKP